MRQKSLYLAGAILSCLVAPLDAGGKGAKYAILIGCSEYDKTQLRPLPYTVNDIEGFKSSLLATGFDTDQIVLLHDKMPQTRYRPLRANILQELELLLSGMKEDDTLIVALSGHGVQFKGDSMGYFCPLDARLDDKKSLIPMDGPGGVYRSLLECKARRKLLIVNACRNDPSSDVALAARKLDLVDEYRDAIPEGIAAIYSCRAGQKSYYDPDRKISLFYEHLNRAWKGDYKRETGRMTLEEVFYEVIVKTKLDANKSLRALQVPEVRREYRGEWVILDKKRMDPPKTKIDLPGSPPVVGPKGVVFSRNGALSLSQTTVSYFLNVQAARGYQIDMKRTSGTLDCYLNVFDPSGTKIAYDDDGGEGLDAKLVFRPASTGNYRIEATSYERRGAGDFSLEVRDVGTAALSGGYVFTYRRLSERVNGTLTTEKSAASYYYSFAAGRSYRIAMTKTSGALDCYLNVYGPDGTKVAYDDDGGEGLNSRLVFRASVNGVHRIEATSFLNKSAGGFLLEVQDADGSADSGSFAGATPPPPAEIFVTPKLKQAIDYGARFGDWGIVRGQGYLYFVNSKSGAVIEVGLKSNGNTWTRDTSGRWFTSFNNGNVERVESKTESALEDLYNKETAPMYERGSLYSAPVGDFTCGDWRVSITESSIRFHNGSLAQSSTLVITPQGRTGVHNGRYLK